MAAQSYRLIKEELMRRVRSRVWLAGQTIPGEIALAARLDIPLIRVEIEATGAAYRHALLSQETVTPPDWLAARLALAPETPVIHVRCLHFADGAPHVLEERWINLAAVPQAADADFARDNPNEWLVAAAPFSNAEFAFSAEVLVPQAARLLDAKPGQASFTAERVTWLGDTAVTLARLSFRPGHRMVTRI
jgi:GntR family transcriptional regulator, histidine utilization repressor